MIEMFGDAPHRVWRMVLAAPHAPWSANDTHRADKYGTAAMRKAWRNHTYQQCQVARLPKGLARVHFDLIFHFTTNGRRDALNYADTAKPIIDAFGPPFVQKPTPKKPQGASAPGWSLIVDDTPQYVAGTELSIGGLWQNVVTAPTYPLTREDVVAYDRGWGGVTIIIAERPAVPPTPPAPRRRADPFPPDVRRRLALHALTGE